MIEAARALRIAYILCCVIVGILHTLFHNVIFAADGLLREIVSPVVTTCFTFCVASLIVAISA